jgi:D-glycero-alpha-D-manno-heptose-7-phosphate kinase
MRGRSRRDLRLLRDHLLLFFAGEARDASVVLSDQDERTKTGDQEMIENLHPTKEIGLRSRNLLVAGDLLSYAELMHEHWLTKRLRSPVIATDRIDELYTLARRSGVIGGKLVGAGGGFLFVYARNPADTRQAMAAAGAMELPFDFEFVGADSTEYA